MSDTPETDEAAFDYDAKAEYWVDAEFAKQLERERDSLRKQLAAALVERDEYKRRWQDWERWAKQVVQHFRRVPLDTDTVGMRNNLTCWMQEMNDQK